MSGMSNYLEAMVVNSSVRGSAFTVPAALYLALFSADPTDDGNVNELAYTGYARQAVTGGWAAPSGADNQSSNTGQIVFPANGSAGNVTASHFGIFDAASAGNCLWTGALSSARTVIPGDQIAFAVGQIVLKPDTV